MCTRLWLGHLKERGLLEDLSVNGTTVLKLNLREVRWDVMDKIDMAQDGDKVTCSFKHGSGPSGFIEVWELLAS